MTETFEYQRHPCALPGDVPDTVEITIDGAWYSFHLYLNTRGRFVALCNTVGCDHAYGEGPNWWVAVSECAHKVLRGRPAKPDHEEDE
jgi:hypothetical protein